jgi:hypothetical protein
LASLFTKANSVFKSIGLATNFWVCCS